jgi:hypothetical protein
MSDEPILQGQDEADFTVGVYGCARCGGDHVAVRFHKFSRPNPSYSHWGLCPVTGEPILMASGPAQLVQIEQERKRG